MTTEQEIAQQVARAVLDAQDLREESYNTTSNSYGMGMMEACQGAAAANNVRTFTEVIYLLNTLAWNDVQSWANENKGS